MAPQFWGNTMELAKSLRTLLMGIWLGVAGLLLVVSAVITAIAKAEER